MRLKYRVSLAVISILMVLTLFLSSSYALWSVTVTQESENLIESGCFDIEIQGVENSKSINLDNTYPMEDAKGLKLTPYKFIVKNTCTVDAKYTLYISSLKDSKTTALADSHIKYSFQKVGNGVLTAQSLTSLTSKSVSEINFTGKTINKTYELSTGTLKGKSSDTADDGGTETYELRLWIDANADNTIMGQSFEAGISAVAYATDLTKQELSYNFESKEQTYTVPEAGKYLLEVWGAQGGGFI